MRKEAIFDVDRTYRYSIKRIWEPSKKKVVFICLNPSTADEYEDDQTMGRCIDFSKRWENGTYGSVQVVNLFAFRTKDPKILKQSLDPIGELNDKYIINAVKNADLVIAAWGENGSFKRRDRDVLDLIKKETKQINCLDVLKGKQPKHPSRAKKDLSLIPYLF
jgi:hypothetical protein